MKKNILILCSFVSWLNSISQVTPNSIRFDVENFIAVNNKGEYYPYSVHGFYERLTSPTKSRIFILPSFSLDLDKIKYLNSKGIESYKESSDIKSIIIPISQDHSLPNESQKAAIVAAIENNTVIHSFYPPLAKNNMGVPMMMPGLNMAVSNSIMTMASQYEANLLFPQQRLIQDYQSNWSAEIVSLSELEITVEFGNSIIYSKRIPATYLSSGELLKKIVIENPSEYLKNVIAEGNAEIHISYKFRDSKKSTVNAAINVSRTIDYVLDEAYRSSVKASSSGWSFLGFGSSKRSIKSSFDQTINENLKETIISNTVVEFYDADDQMIKAFENEFFPEITKEELIKNHEAAAAKAKAEGNNVMYDLHMKYIEQVKSDNPNLTPNIEAALASLGKKDYIGFIAHGVRWGSNENNGNSSYRRTLNSSEMANVEQKWLMVKTLSMQHAITQPVELKKEVTFSPTLGAIDGFVFEDNLLMNDGFFNNWQTVKGVIVGPIIVGGAFQKNNIYAGTLLTKIGSVRVYSPQTLKNALANYEPGQRVNLTTIVQIGNYGIYPVYQERQITIELTAYPERK